MKNRSELPAGRRGRAGTLLAGAGLLLLLLCLGWSGPAGALILPEDLPVTEPSYEFTAGIVEIVWQEAAPTLGRQAEIIERIGWDPDSSRISEVSLTGNYTGDCDYRLRMALIPPGAGVGRNVQVLYRLYETEQAVGSPVALDTLDLYESNVSYPFDPAIAGDVAFRVTENIQQPATQLGTIPVEISGLCTTFGYRADYVVTPVVATPSFTSALTDSLVVEVIGPIVFNDSTTSSNRWSLDTLVVHTPGDTLATIDGMRISFPGPGGAAPTDSVIWTTHRVFPSTAGIVANLEAFEGYHFWRSDLPDHDEFELLAEIRVCESKYEIALLSEDEFIDLDLTLTYDAAARRFRVRDEDVHDDFPYRYAVSTFDQDFLGNQQDRIWEGTLAATGKFYPGPGVRDRAEEVYVVPNPFKASAAWQEGDPKVVFRNLPTRATVRIYTVSGELVTTFEHGPGVRCSTSPTCCWWDLRSEAGLNVVSGIYIFHVEGTNDYVEPIPGGEPVARSESLEQIGKFMIVR